MTYQIKPKKIAVVGGGIYGITVAIKLAQKNYQVDLFEKNSDILLAASGINQYRLHRGYHYPRSTETVSSSLETEPHFKEEYRDAIIEDLDHYYCIAKEGSLISGKQYLEFCKKHNLEFTEVDFPLVNRDKIDVCIKAQESLIDIHKLKEICRQRLEKYGVRVLLNTTASDKDLEKYDFVVICTYAHNNSLLNKKPHAHKSYQYEVCEKPVLKLPPAFRNKSIVIMDGPFMCVDPFSTTDTFVMGNVVHAIHHTNIGKHPEIPESIKPFLNRGVIKNPPVTNITKFIGAAAEFMPEIRKAEHVGSMFTIRTVLPYQDHTDARPTIVEKIDEKTVAIFSGKISNCVKAAEEIVKIVSIK